MRSFYKLFFLCLFILDTGSSHALTNVDITRGSIDPIPIAIPKFSSNDESMASKIKEVIVNDLERTGLIRVMNERSYIEEATKIETVPDFISWRQINASALVVGKIERSGGKLQISFKIWDVFSQKEKIAKSFVDADRDWRSMSHKVADEIYKRLTGEQGYFNTKVAYVAVESDDYGTKLRRIAIMDQDGENHSYLTNGKNIVLTPRFSPDSKSILYLSYHKSAKPKVYIMDIKTRASRALGEFPGMSFSPRYTADGKSALLSVEQKGVSNIHLLDLNSMSQRKLTNCSSICVSPSPSPSKNKIVFTSDMGGNSGLYVMNFDGSNIKRISFGEGNYSNPAWSPRGDLIAFTKIVSGEGFYIGVMKPDGSGERVIASGWLVEGPTWSPNGRVIMFEKQDGPRKKTKIHTIDITGSNERVVETAFSGSDPSWSNLLN